METKATRDQIKRIKKLHDPKERAREGVFLIEGVRLMEEALREGVILQEVFHTAGIEEKPRGKGLLADLGKRRTPLFTVSEKDMQSMAETETPQGILAVAKQKEPTLRLQEILSKKGVVLAVCGLQDPGNLGTMIRTADAAGAVGMITTDDTVDCYNPKVVRASMGSLFRFPVTRVNNIQEILARMKREGYRIVATAAQSPVSYLDIQYQEKCVLLIGREGSGLPEELLEMADEKVFIPMRDGVESLNAAISAAILIYEVRRQRRA